MNKHKDYTTKWLFYPTIDVVFITLDANLATTHFETTKMKAITIFMLFSVVALAACDPNSKPTYGKETGLPKNCRAIVQQNIDAYRAKQYTADEVMASLERNCGANGHSWGQ